MKYVLAQQHEFFLFVYDSKCVAKYCLIYLYTVFFTPCSLQKHHTERKKVFSNKHLVFGTVIHNTFFESVDPHDLRESCMDEMTLRAKNWILI